jgi:hypothetical protein
MHMRIHRLVVTVALPLFMAAGGCSSSSNPSVDASGTGGTGGSTDGPTTDAVVLPAGPVAGPADDHCAGGKVQEVDPAVCHAGPRDAGADDGGAEEPAPVRYNAEADDDDCKYHVSFSTSAPVALNSAVFFTAKVTRKSDGKPASWGAMDALEVLTEDMSHPVDVKDPPVQGPLGTAKFGPVKLDRRGKWIVRFHIHEECTDNDEASQHGHVAFFINVP